MNKESHLRLNIFDSILEPVMYVDKHAVVVYCNDAAAEMLGSSSRKIIRSHLPISQIIKFEKSIADLNLMELINEPTPYVETNFESVYGKMGRVQVSIQKGGEILNSSQIIQDNSGIGNIDNKNYQWIVFLRDVTLEQTLQTKYRSELEKKENYITELEVARAELADYSKNLETKVEQRTHELAYMNRLMGALLDSLGQGFFIFNEQGRVLDISTKACVEICGHDPKGKLVTDVLGFNNDKADKFKKWMKTVFAEMLPFEDLAPLAPSQITSPKNRAIELKYYPIRLNQESIDGVVTVATDITDLIQAQNDFAKEKANSEMLFKMIAHENQFKIFFQDTQNLIKILTDNQKANYDANEVLRILHTLKGGALQFGLIELAELAHQAEQLLVLNPLNNDDQVIELNQMSQNKMCIANKIDEIKSSFDRFTNDYSMIISKWGQNSTSGLNLDENKIISFANNHLSAWPGLNELFLNEFLYEPIKNYLEPLNEVWMDTAKQLGKAVMPIQINHKDLKLWMTPYRKILNTFIHVVRNSADHGIEFKVEREKHNKSEFGLFKIDIQISNQDIIFKFSDDGAGIDPQIIRNKLIDKGVDVAKQSDEHVIQHIFDPQFSTKNNVSLISGRGVGMDAVAYEASRLGGQVWVKSKKDQGLELFVRVSYIRPNVNSYHVAS